MAIRWAIVDLVTCYKIIQTRLIGREIFFHGATDSRSDYQGLKQLHDPESQFLADYKKINYGETIAQSFYSSLHSRPLPEYSAPRHHI